MDGASDRLLDPAVTIADHTNTMLAYWDRDLMCRFANNAYINWFGLSPGEMVDKIRLPDLLGKVYTLNKPYVDGVLSGKTQIFERTLTLQNGQERATLATYCPDIDNETVKGFFVHVADITPIKSLRTSLSGVTAYMEGSNTIDAVQQSLNGYLLTGFPGIAKLASQHFISPSKLKRDFKIACNQTVFARFREMQMELAYTWLVNKQFSRKQVAAMLGFSNPSNFSACYTKYLKKKEASLAIAALKEENDRRYKTFVNQSPISIAMVDNQMRYMVVSNKWKEAHGVTNMPIEGKFYYDVHPETRQLWQKIHAHCLQGNADAGEMEVPASTTHDTTWLKWDIKPWYDGDNLIGGLMIYTEDITALKSKAEDNRKILEILTRTNEITRIGAWKRNFITNEVTWSKITKQILEVPDNYSPDVIATSLNFYKKGRSRNLIKKVLHDALTKGKSFDVEVEVITAKGNQKLVRVVGCPQLRNGKCEKLMGVFQDITKYRPSAER